MEGIAKRFSDAETYAKASRSSRWLARPVRHFKGFFWSYFWSRISGKTVDTDAILFTGDHITVPLPAGLEFYLAGVKVHDSELRLAKYLFHAVQAGDTVIDVGAHLGFYSLILAHIVGPAGRVIAFEPSTMILPYLRKNTAAYPQIEIVHAMIAEQDAKTRFFEFGIRQSEFNTSVENSPNIGRATVRHIQAFTLDSYCVERNLRPVLLKIDVEGGELAVLKGGTHTLSGTRAIAIEIRKDDYDRLYAGVIALLIERGFAPYRIEDNGTLTALDDVRRYVMDLAFESDNLVFKS